VVREFIDPEYGYDCETIGYELSLHLATQAEIETARMLVERCMEPAADQVIKGELARLRASTKSREIDDDLVLVFQVMAEECASYPADVVVWALRGWARAETFYPSLAEIRDRLQRGARRRQSLLSGLRT
jgi:hypothetical protein